MWHRNTLWKSDISFDYVLILMLINFSVITVLTVFMATTSLLWSSDAGFDFNNARKLYLYGELFSGPIIPQILYAFLFFFFGLNCQLLIIVQSLCFLIIIIESMILFDEIFPSHRIVTSFIPIGYLMVPHLFYFVVDSGKSYALMMVFALGSIILLERFLSTQDSKYILGSGVLLSLAYLTHMISIPFLFFPAIMFLFLKFKTEVDFSLKSLTMLYLTALIAVTPYLLWRIINDGIYFYQTPASWYLIKYGVLTNIAFWKMPRPFTLNYYSFMLEIVLTYMGIPVFLTLISILRQKEVIPAAWLVSFLIPIVVSRLVPAYNYLFPIFPAVIIGSYMLILKVYEFRRSRKVRTGIIVFLVVFCSFNAVELISIHTYYQTRFVQSKSQLDPILEMIPDHSRVLFRSYLISPFLPNCDVIMLTFDIEEKDAICYLNWTSESKVAEIMNQYQIDYILLYKEERWERDYNFWFTYVTGSYPVHYLKIKNSTIFSQISESEKYVLYAFIG